MQSNPTEHFIVSKVIRAITAVWVETVDKHLIDLSKYPKMGVVIDNDPELETLYCVVAYPRIDNNEIFEVIFETYLEEAANKFYQILIEQLKNPHSVH